eukprot:629464-Lingulodinium_polyedra.AAC.1
METIPMAVVRAPVYHQCMDHSCLDAPRVSMPRGNGLGFGGICACAFGHCAFSTLHAATLPSYEHVHPGRDSWMHTGCA